ncbi:MAG: hypothetical protein VW999_14125 [Alphaproteobacteria bacterium]
MSDENTIRLRTHSPAGEKRGNTSWVQCAACEGWFHATEDIVNRAVVTLHCNHCHTEFLPADAKKIVLA